MSCEQSGKTELWDFVYLRFFFGQKNMPKRKRDCLNEMPLEDPATMCHPSELSRTRVECLHDTLKLFRKNKDKYLRRATRNLVRWSHNQQSSGDDTILICMEEDSLTAVASLTRQYGTIFACLNMANSTYPGGAYTLGHPAQEENIFRRTDAHFSLTNAVLTRNQGGVVVYTEEMQHLINADEGRVYFSKTPLICIKGKEDGSMPNLGYELLKKNDIFSFYELRSAAVNANKVKKNLWSFHKIKETMTQRIHAQFRTLIENKVRHVVLSAFGCGAFGNDAFMVANIYKDAIGVYKDNFSVIAFAIYYAGVGVNNYDIFSNVLISQKSSTNEHTEEIDKSGDYPSEDKTDRL